MTANDLAAAFDTLPAAWREVLPAWTPARIDAVIDNVRRTSGDAEIAPNDPFRALRFAAPEQVKVVLLGQDPYPRPGHADGLAFSAGHGKPHSLQRVFDRLRADRPGFEPPSVWKLDAWARQGALLLNPVLTVQVNASGSHMQCGWQALTSQIISMLCRRPQPPTFLLWGKPAQAFFDSARSDGRPPRVLRTRHPSHDFHRQFMVEGSHFVATQALVDWWCFD
jgi:uracil-DNA glycosylase